jgi:hypothetical protein
MSKKHIITLIVVIIILIIAPVFGFLIKYKVLLLRNDCISEGNKNVCRTELGCSNLNNGLVMHANGYRCKCQGFDNRKPANCPPGYMCDGFSQGWHCFKKK